MKTGIFRVISLLVASNFSESGSIIVPKKVEDAFKMKYKNANDVEWNESESLYTALFEWDDYYYEATFDADGNWIETVIDLEDYDLPDVVTAHLTKTYEEFTLLWAVKAIDPIRTVFKVTIEVLYTSDEEEETMNYDLLFDEEGKLLEE